MIIAVLLLATALNAKTNRFSNDEFLLEVPVQFANVSGYSPRPAIGVGLEWFWTMNLSSPYYLYVGDHYLRTSTNLIGIFMLKGFRKKGFDSIRNLSGSAVPLGFLFFLGGLESFGFHGLVAKNLDLSLGFSLFTLQYIQNTDEHIYVRNRDTFNAMGLLRLKLSYFLTHRWFISAMYEPGILYNSEKTVAHFLNLSLSYRFY